MKPPTKYENMRMNRAAAECRAAHGPAGAAIPALPDKPAAEPTKPPTMTVDGVEYIEKPSWGCPGCINHSRDGFCGLFGDVAKVAFGGTCDERAVIYVKAS